MHFLKSFLVATALGLSASSVLAAAAASCSRTDVQAAVNATPAGGTVTIPAGNCTWNTGGASAAGVRVLKPLTIVGAGAAPGGTKITYGTMGENPLIRVNVGTQTGKVDISGIWFQGTNPNVTIWGATAIGWEGPVGWKNLRIHHNLFRDHKQWSLRGPAYVHGLIDHNTFKGNGFGMIFSGQGDTDWTTPLVLGSADFMFVEDNTFDWNDFFGTTGVPTMDMENGGRAVFRHNHVRFGFMETHDKARNGLPSANAYEVYNNQFVRDNATNQWKGLDISAGTGVIWGNTFSGDYTHAIGGIDYKTAIGETDDIESIYVEPCDGTDASDQNVTGESGWRCEYQIGTQNFGANAFSYPLYLWSNTKNGTAAQMMVTAGSSHVQAGRDYINNGTAPKPGYTPYVYPHPLNVP